MALHHTKLLALLALLGPVASSEIRSHGRMLTIPDDECYTCFDVLSPLQNSKGWYMGPFPGSYHSDATYEYPMYTNGAGPCERDDDVGVAGSMTLTVKDFDNNGELEFEVVIVALPQFGFFSTQVYISIVEPSGKRPDHPELESSSCFVPGEGISNSTC
jgi:hypothetical protein